MIRTDNKIVVRCYTAIHRQSLLPTASLQRCVRLPHHRMVLTASFKSTSSTLSVQPLPSVSSVSSLQSNQQDHPSWYDEWKFLMLILQRLLMGLGVVHCFTNYVMDITLCSGPSMLPTIKESNEIILIDRFAVLKGSIQDGTTMQSRTNAALNRRAQEQTSSADASSATLWAGIRMGVGGFTANDQQQSSDQRSNTIFTTWRTIIEHIISPISVGDVVIAQNPNRPGTICKRILGLPGDQVIVLNDRSGSNSGTNIQIVPDHHVWLEGDNANNSLDSRQSGPISLALLRGRAVARIWPLRGDAYLKRTISPPTTTIYSDAGSSQCCSNSIVIPAGHQIRFGPAQSDQ
jgi:signal peptidase I